MASLPKNSNNGTNTLQEKKRNFHPLLQELDISPVDSSDACRLTSISPADLLSYLLETHRLPEKTVRDAVRTIHEKKQAVPDNNQPKQPNEKIENGSVSQNPDITPHPTITTGTTRNATDRTRHVALRFFYDGALFSGLAQNIGCEIDNSVERQLFDALLKARLVVSRETSGFSRCGRTDRGVSAVGQVVALNIKSAFPVNASWDEDGSTLLETKDLPKNEHVSQKVWIIPRSKKKTNTTTTKDNMKYDDSDKSVTMNRMDRDMKEYSYSKILNNILPPSIRILGWTPVTEAFSARFSASARTYRYFFCKRQMNIDSIRDGLRQLVGKHDFRNFCKMDVEKVYNFERVIHSAELIQLSTTKTEGDKSSRHQEVCYLQIIGQAFLWHQIRCIAEVIFMIGRGYESPTIISELFDVKKHPGKPSYSLANEKPLVLHDCGYRNLQFGHSVHNLWTVSCQLEKQWEELILAAARLRSAIDSFRRKDILKEDLIVFANSKLNERSKKLQRKGLKHNSKTNHHSDQRDIPETIINDFLESSTIISWNDSLLWLAQRNLVPCSNSLTNSVHVPLMQRSMGPSYEEKVESLKKSEKRRLKFESNIIKKRKSAEEDKLFYDHKAMQGGSGI
mmetsp:Transcript_29793/g.32017  ORF Transcript_29793/g.32017 Transcript_29793/m.32017 type:complete len:622 (-) Transcript_29793:105-1970(-)